MNRTEVVEMKE